MNYTSIRFFEYTHIHNIYKPIVLGHQYPNNMLNYCKLSIETFCFTCKKTDTWANFLLLSHFQKKKKIQLYVKNFQLKTLKSQSMHKNSIGIVKYIFNILVYSLEQLFIVHVILLGKFLAAPSCRQWWLSPESQLCTFLPTLCSVTSHWELEIGHGGILTPQKNPQMLKVLPSSLPHPTLLNFGSSAHHWV